MINGHGTKSSRVALIWTIALIALVAGIDEVKALPLAAIDQQNPEPWASSNGALSIDFGQSFRPTFSSIDAFEFALASTDGTNIVVDLLDGVAGFDGLGGRLIATTLPSFVKTSGGVEIFHFDFASTIPLTPSNTYVGRIRNVGSATFGVFQSPDTYSGGQYLHGDWPLRRFVIRDMVFATGVHIPEPAAATLGLLGMTALVIRWNCGNRATYTRRRSA